MYLGFVYMLQRAWHVVQHFWWLLHAMQRRCVALYLLDPAITCKLFDTPNLPILSYSCEVWAVVPRWVRLLKCCTGKFQSSCLVLALQVSTCQQRGVSLSRFTFGSRCWPFNTTCVNIQLDTNRLDLLYLFNANLLNLWW